MSHSENIALYDSALDLTREFAERISRILNDQGEQIDAQLQEWLDDLLGAIYAVRLAVEQGYDPKSGPVGENRRKERLRVLLLRAGELASSSLGGKTWIGGFQFNNAMFRISSTLDRGLKMVLETPSNKKESRGEKIVKASLAKEWCEHKTGRKWNDDNAQFIREEVEHLKHHDGIQERRAGLDEALAAISELLDLVEARVNP